MTGASTQTDADTDTVLELYSVRDAARLFGLTESRLRYWIQTGFVRPSVRQGGRFYYTFSDMIGIKAAVELLSAGVGQDAVRRALDALRRQLPPRVGPTSRLKVCSDGETLAVVEEGEAAWDTDPAQLVIAFGVAALGGQIAERLTSAPPAPADRILGAREASAPEPIEAGAGPTERN
ncbi:MAG TPA: helix-turn-helix domain-containing protein, partial [Kofleriaceae bacterium]|nr:helix-turn-helix domain-containing protein [Kofleriaceae bacterium]